MRTIGSRPPCTSLERPVWERLSPLTAFIGPNSSRGRRIRHADRCYSTSTVTHLHHVSAPETLLSVFLPQACRHNGALLKLRIYELKWSTEVTIQSRRYPQGDILSHVEELFVCVRDLWVGYWHDFPGVFRLILFRKDMLSWSEASHSLSSLSESDIPLPSGSQLGSSPTSLSWGTGMVC